MQFEITNANSGFISTNISRIIPFFINVVMKNLTAAVFITKALISCEGMSLNEEWGMGNSMLLRLSWISCCHCQTKQEWDLMPPPVRGMFVNYPR